MKKIIFNAAGRVRAGWRMLLFFALFLALTPLAGSLVDSLVARHELGPFRTQLLFYAALIGATLMASALCLRWLDRYPFRSLGYQWREGGWREYLLGFGLASLMITGIVLLELPLGHLELRWSARSFAETVRGMSAALLFFHVAATFEEILFRGYPLQTLLRDVRPEIAVSAPSLLFGLGHAGNPNASELGVFNTVLAGVWLSIAYMKTRRLWLPIGLHTGWNFTMGAVYGLTVSGLSERFGAPLFHAVQSGPGWFTGGDYGPEGGILTTGLLLGATLWLWRTPRIRPADRRPSGVANPPGDDYTHASDETAEASDRAP